MLIIYLSSGLIDLFLATISIMTFALCWCYCAIGEMQKFRREYVTVYNGSVILTTAGEQKVINTWDLTSLNGAWLPPIQVKCLGYS